MKIPDLNTKLLTRLVILAVIALILAAGSFGSYYYWDRYVHLGDKSPLEKSIGELEATVRAKPAEPGSRLALAETYLQNGRYDEAIAQAQQVLSAYPDSDRAMLTIGIANVFKNKPEAAVEPLEKFVEIHNASSQWQMDMVLETALYYLGESYLKLNRPLEAIPTLSKALEISATDADAMYQLGLAYSKTGQPDKALVQYQEAVRFVPDFAEAYQGMVESYAALHQPEYANYARGMEAFAGKDYQAARTQLETISNTIPDFAPAQIGLGLTYEQLGDLKAAQASLRRALILEPNNFTASQALGRVEALLGNK